MWAHLEPSGLHPQRPALQFSPRTMDRYPAKSTCGTQLPPLFDSMKYTQDPLVLYQFIPLIFGGRDPSEEVAATRSAVAQHVGGNPSDPILHQPLKPAFEVGPTTQFNAGTDRSAPASLHHRPTTSSTIPATSNRCSCPRSPGAGSSPAPGLRWRPGAFRSH